MRPACCLPCGGWLSVALLVTAVHYCPVVAPAPIFSTAPLLHNCTIVFFVSSRSGVKCSQHFVKEIWWRKRFCIALFLMQDYCGVLWVHSLLQMLTNAVFTVRIRAFPPRDQQNDSALHRTRNSLRLNKTFLLVWNYKIWDQTGVSQPVENLSYDLLNAANKQYELFWTERPLFSVDSCDRN